MQPVQSKEEPARPDEYLVKSCLADSPKNPASNIAYSQKAHFNRNREILSLLLEQLRSAGSLLLHDRVVALSDELDNFSIGVSMVGQVKAGKTALTNALIGKPEMLPSDVNPWTSVVTSVHINTPKPAGKTAVFNFFTSEEWLNMVETGGTLGQIANRAGFSDEMDDMRRQIRDMQNRTQKRLGQNFNLLMGSKHSFLGFSSTMLRKYVCLGDEDETSAVDGRYADVTKSADIYIDNESYRIPTIIRDTPGVNDPFLLRESVTLESLEETDIFVLVLGAQQSFSTVDVGLLRIIRSMKKEQIILFVNRVDELRDPANQISEIDAYIRGILREEDLPQDIPIIFGSAVWAEMASFGMHGDVAHESMSRLTDLVANRLQQTHDDSELQPGTTRNTVSKTADLSGLFELQRIIQQKSVKDVAIPQLSSITRRALDIASSSRIFLEQIDDTSWVTRPEVDLDDMVKTLEAMQEKAQSDLTEQVQLAANKMWATMTKAYQAFHDREHAAIQAELAENKSVSGWQPDLEGLRRALNASYTEFAEETPGRLAKIISAATCEVQAIYNSALNDAVQIITVEPPEIHSPKKPVSLMRSMSLDVTSSWLVGWLTDRGKRPTYLRKLQQIVSAEKEETLKSVESSYVSDFLAENSMILDGFFENHIVGLKNIAMLNCPSKRQDVLRSLGMEEEVRKRVSMLSQITCDLNALLDRLAVQAEAYATGH